MPTSQRAIPALSPRVPSRPTRPRPANSRPARRAGRTTGPLTIATVAKGTVAVAIIIVSLTTAGCGQPAEESAAVSAPVSQQECVSAVYTVLSGMIVKPDDNAPFDDFVTRYGTASPTYAAYRDSFDPFYSEASAHGIKAAETAVHATVTKDCSTAS